MASAVARNGADLAAVLDACIDALLSEHATVRECLERWPKHSDALRPLLEAGMGLRAFGREESALAVGE